MCRKISINWSLEPESTRLLHYRLHCDVHPTYRLHLLSDTCVFNVSLKTLWMIISWFLECSPLWSKKLTSRIIKEILECTITFLKKKKKNYFIGPLYNSWPGIYICLHYVTVNLQNWDGYSDMCLSLKSGIDAYPCKQFENFLKMHIKAFLLHPPVSCVLQLLINFEMTRNEPCQTKSVSRLRLIPK